MSRQAATGAPTLPLFEDPPEPATRRLAEGALLLRARAAAQAGPLWQAVQQVLAAAPLRHMQTRVGRMSVAMSNCGEFGWVSDARGYRYARQDPGTGRPWPAMPRTFSQLAAEAAAEAGFDAFEPDACLINCYAAGARLALHQDRNESDYSQPIVSVSLGLPARFQFGGLERSERPLTVPLAHGDVVVWGGPARLRYHGVLPLAAGEHPLTGACRINLTLRRVRGTAAGPAERLQ